MAFAGVGDGAAVVICSHGVEFAGVGDEAAVVICSLKVSSSPALEMALLL